jgi:hypothetical protein
MIFRQSILPYTSRRRSMVLLAENYAYFVQTLQGV